MCGIVDKLERFPQDTCI